MKRGHQSPKNLSASSPAQTPGDPCNGPIIGQKIERSRQHARIRIRLNQGRFEVLGLGAWHSYWKSPYYLMLTVPWQGFFAITVGLYAIANAVFACLFLAGGEGTIINARPYSFWDAFFFSVQTSASIGYGVMSPGTHYGHLLVTLEAILSLLGIAVLTGLAYARVSRPTAQVMFSQVAVVTPFQGVPTLMFRAANERRNQILEAQMRVYITLDEHSEGRMMRRFYELELLRDRTPTFVLTWTGLHPITENSPLYGLNQNDLIRANAAIIISITGIDQTVVQAIHTRHTYYATDIMWSRQFKDIIHQLDNGDRCIDFADFHTVE